MSNFSTNWLLYSPLTPKKKQKKSVEEEDLPKEIRKKIRLIEKAFR